MIAIVLFLLIIASIFDAKTGMVPLWIAPAALVARFCYLCIHPDLYTILWDVFVGLGLFVFYYLYAFYEGRLGGADCMIIATVGFSLGYYGLYTTMLAALLSIPHILVARKRQNQTYPFIPYISAGYILMLFILGEIYGMHIPFFA